MKSVKQVYLMCWYFYRLLVKMDDNIIRHYSNESTFVISIKKNEETHESQLNYDVTLVEIEPEVPQ